jgi:CRISPR system Cascade subunit CasD
MAGNTLFLRLEGPLQSWGDQQSKLVIRRTAEAPTKSGVIGLLCAALGVPRAAAPDRWLPTLAGLRMGVRIDRPGFRWWDYHTVGAGMDMRTAEGSPKKGAMLTRREYLSDASFLVALQGDPELVSHLTGVVENPVWTPFLGRKSCPPSRPLLVKPSDGEMADPLAALAAMPWQRRLSEDHAPASVDCLLDWAPTADRADAPDDAEVWYDVPLSLEPPGHRPRFVVRHLLMLGPEGNVRVADTPAQRRPLALPRPRADYQNSEYRKARADRLDADAHLCVFCKARAVTVQHITYRRAGGSETSDDLRSLCRLCHDAVTMIEYGRNMGMDRINPEDRGWREEIIRKRAEIIRFRSLETRRRRLSPEEVE